MNCKMKPVPGFEYWWEVKVVAICCLPDWQVCWEGQWGLWDSRALGLWEPSGTGCCNQSLPSVPQYLGLCLTSSRCSSPFDLVCATAEPPLMCAEGSAWVRPAKTCVYFGGPEERKMSLFRAGCWAFLEGAEHPQLQGLSAGVDNAQCQSWNKGYY